MNNIKEPLISNNIFREEIIVVDSEVVPQEGIIISDLNDEEIEEQYYCGEKSCLIGILLLIICWPASFIVCLCPCDSKKKKETLCCDRRNC